MDRTSGPERLGIEVERRPDVARPADAGASHEDFLFHLYRGSELLQENRVHEAKEELEFALTLQPHDPKAEDLLGAVYFRLGMYVRAIQIYQGLAGRFTRDAAIKVNLALCHMKSGQHEPAAAALREAVALDPEHKRAWGYLGLVLQKSGALDEAQAAFERGGHGMMAKRVVERRLHPSVPPPPDSLRQLDEGVRRVAETAFAELDGGALTFSLAPSEPARAEGPWHTLEIGHADWPAQGHAGTPTSGPRPSQAPPAPAPAVLALEAPSARTAAVHPTGVAVVGVDAHGAFAARLDALRVVVGAAATRALFRRTRESETTEVLGGIGSPMVRVTGATQLVLGPRPEREAVVLSLDAEQDTAWVREDVLLGFDLGLAYENTRPALDPDGAARTAEGMSIVQLHGMGAVVLEVAGKLASVASNAARPLVVRRESLVGWLGKATPRPLAAAQSLNGQRGLVSFTGEGTVLVCFG